MLPLDERIALPASPPSENGEVLEALSRLPAAERNVLYLFYFEGYSAKEIGKLLHRSENATYILLTRARKRLKKLWEEDEDEQ